MVLLLEARQLLDPNLCLRDRRSTEPVFEPSAELQPTVFARIYFQGDHKPQFRDTHRPDSINMGANWFSRLFHSKEPKTKRRSSGPGEAVLSELAIPPPIENPDDGPIYRHHTLEEALTDASNDRPGHEHDAAGELVHRRRSLEEAYAHIKKEEGI